MPAIVGLEMQRQSSYASAHTWTVPLGWSFVLSEFQIHWINSGPRITDSGFTGSIRVEFEVLQSVDGIPRKLKNSYRWFDENGDPVGFGTGSATVLSSEKYQILQKRSQSSTAELFSGSGDFIEVQWDRQDTFFTDKPGDHMTSMVLLDFFENEIYPATTVDMDAEFFRFAIPEIPTFLSIENLKDSSQFSGTFIQRGSIVASALATTI